MELITSSTIALFILMVAGGVLLSEKQLSLTLLREMTVVRKRTTLLDLEVLTLKVVKEVALAE